MKEFLETVDKVATSDSKLEKEKVSLAFFCKQLRLNYGKLTDEEKKLLRKDYGKFILAEKSKFSMEGCKEK